VEIVDEGVLVPVCISSDGVSIVSDGVSFDFAGLGSTLGVEASELRTPRARLSSGSFSKVDQGIGAVAGRR
jgi:hypothetical protein